MAENKKEEKSEKKEKKGKSGKKEKVDNQKDKKEIADVVADAVGDLARKGTKKLIKSVEKKAGDLVDTVTPGVLKTAVGLDSTTEETSEKETRQKAGKSKTKKKADKHADKKEADE